MAYINWYLRADSAFFYQEFLVVENTLQSYVLRLHEYVQTSSTITVIVSSSVVTSAYTCTRNS